VKLVGLYPNPEASVDSSDFLPASGQTLRRGGNLTGAADSKTGILSFWARLDGSNGADLAILLAPITAGNLTNTVFVKRDAANKFIIFAALDTTPTTTLILNTTATYTSGATWRHVLMSWDLAAAATHLYVNDVSDKTVGLANNNAVKYTGLGDWEIGNGGGGLVPFDGCLAEIYFAAGQYLDFSIVFNRRKFISNRGKPVTLGPDGRLPTGTPPIIYQHINKGEAVANFGTNRGSGGGFTITGTLATGSTSPSD
jgi:hypothetical protein